MDGKAMLLVANRKDHYDLYRQSLTSNRSQLLASIHNGANEQATVSPDGRWIILETYPFLNPAESNQISRIPTEGGPPEPVLKVGENRGSFSCARRPSSRCVFADISPDYKQMIVSNFDAVQGRGAEITHFELGPNFNPELNFATWSISPDGTRFAASLGPSGPIRVYSFNDHSVQLIYPKAILDMTNLAWSADGGAFYFSNRTNNGMEILHMDMQGNTTSLWRNNGRTFCTPSPDGRYLAIYDWKTDANIWMMENY